MASHLPRLAAWGAARTKTAGLPHQAFLMLQSEADNDFLHLRRRVKVPLGGHPCNVHVCCRHLQQGVAWGPTRQGSGEGATAATSRGLCSLL